MTHLLLLAALSTLPQPSALRCASLVPQAVVAAKAHGESAAVLLAVAYTETRCKTWLVGSVGELGAWQVRPAYARSGGDADDGGRMLARWRKRCGKRALACYNAGFCGRKACGTGYQKKVQAAVRILSD